MHRLVPALVAEMGAAYPELVRAQPLIEATLEQEETRFRQTLANGLRLLDEATGGHGPGRHAARRNRLQALRHLRLPLRPDRGRACAARHRRRPRRLRLGHGRAEGRGPRRLEGLGRQGAPTNSGSTSPRSSARPNSPAISAHEGEGVVLAIVKDGARVDRAEVGDDGRSSCSTRRLSTARAAARSATPEN